VVAGIGAREAAAHGGQRDAGCLAQRKSTAEVILSYDLEKVPAGSMGIGSLAKSRFGSRPRRLCVLECGSVRERRPENGEDPGPDAEGEAIRYVN
jgi:hypothetical protein